MANGRGLGNHFQGTGCSSSNQGSGIYAITGQAAHEVHGCIYLKYLGMGEANSALGFPTSDETSVAGQRVSYFEHGAIYCCTTNTYEVQGAIYNLYASYGGPNSWLGFPISDEYSVSAGRESDFQNGYIVWNATTGQTTAYTYSGGGCHCYGPTS